MPLEILFYSNFSVTAGSLQFKFVSVSGSVSNTSFGPVAYKIMPQFAVYYINI